MKFISLFAGIGGFDLGLERAGMECVGQVEYNPFCQRVLKHHWPHVKLVGDIHDVAADSFGAVDLICGGFPCQPFSNAGKRKGTADDRYLWPEMLRVIQAYRPAWVLGENVAGIVNMELDNVLSDLEREGYETQAFIIPACAVDAKHERKRVWILAHSAQCRSERNIGSVSGENEQQEAKRQKEWIRKSFDASQSSNVPNAHCSGFGERRRAESIQPELNTAERAGQDVADSKSLGSRRGLCEDRQEQNGYQLTDGCTNVADTEGERFSNGHDSQLFGSAPGKINTPSGASCDSGELEARRWLPEPGILRVAHGVPGRVDRLRSLGNAVVPQIVEVIGRAIQRAQPEKCAADFGLL